MHSHLKLYKPYGYLSQFITNEKPRKKNKKLLGELFDFPEGTMSIGRLDQDSEGLLLLTTDGKVSAEVTGKKVEKEYFVQVDGQISEEAVEALREGVEISINGNKYQTLPSKAQILSEKPVFPERTKKIRDERHGPTSWISVTLTEGKFRQVKKMTAAVGFPTLRLVRVRIGNEKLENMQPGQVVKKANFRL
ncbi:pseudouridine synthase [Zunongwangia sp. F260]|uniref:Pseudouridine synthase n=1 Tax=Autumnicola lenta TaxID=3075593 RepID=A0ABU3CPH4_9FLAO|nr:pseudouridine synthase [Zunongwangia sp. F260]MDT0648261.1 pseudouridine synthase [Zunongwangia sp. F260]